MIAILNSMLHVIDRSKCRPVW